MKKTTVVSIAAVLSATAALGTAAKEPNHLPEHIQQRFIEADSNKDGVVTHAEMMLQVEKRFNVFDKNRDGYLVLQELPKIMPIPEHKKERMKKHKEKMKQRMAGRGHEMPEGMPEAMPAEMEERFGARGKPTRLRFVAKLDRDGDERVSLEEFARKAARKFKRGDVNGDGSITLAELEETKKHHMKKRFKEKRHHRG